jgi:hypothetical protein
MTDIVKGMARAYFETHFADGWSYAEMEEKVPGHNADVEHSMRAALLWLSEHVSDEMAREALEESKRVVVTGEPEAHLPNVCRVIAAAIRAAAGGGE